MLLSRYLSNREKQWGIIVVPEQRVLVKPTRFRVPDISVLAGSAPAGPVAQPKRTPDHLAFHLEVEKRGDRWLLVTFRLGRSISCRSLVVQTQG